MMDVGKWDQELFDQFKAAPAGPRKRFLLDKLLKQNLPLVKILVSQLAGVTDEKTPVVRRRTAARSKVPYADECQWEDLLQAGLCGMATALERFDPSKGKIAGYARWQILYQMQKLTKTHHFVHTPDDKWDQRPGVSFFDDEAVIDRMAGEDVNLFEEEPWKYVESVEQAREWAADMGNETAQAEIVAESRKVISIPKPVIVIATGLDRFLRHFKFARSGRVDIWTAYNTYRIECRRIREDEMSRKAFLQAMAERGAKERIMRIDGRVCRALYGILPVTDRQQAAL
jgi:sigma-70-like protein